MKFKKHICSILAGGAAGTINGLFGAGGGMVLVPILSHYSNLEEHQVFPCSIFIILPISIVSVCANIQQIGPSLQKGWPYLIGGVIGGLMAGLLGHFIPTKYLHRIFGLLILGGGIRHLC